mgnify:CR=1 FL=1
MNLYNKRCFVFRSFNRFNLITPSEKPLLTQVEQYFQQPILEFSEKYLIDDELDKF